MIRFAPVISVDWKLGPEGAESHPAISHSTAARSGVVVGYTVRLGQEEADRGVEAFVGISTEPKSARDVTQRLAAFPELRQLCSVSGEFDYMALLRADSTARLDALLDEIGAIEGVRKTTTSVLLARRIDRTSP